MFIRLGLLGEVEGHTGVPPPDAQSTETGKRSRNVTVLTCRGRKKNYHFFFFVIMFI